MNSSSKRLPYILWFVAALFYFYQFILRVSPNVMMNDFMEAFNINATAFATFAALASYAYAILQIPSGLLVDQYGPKKTILLSLICLIVGTVLIATTDHFTIAQAGRILIGVGSAASFVSVTKVVALWFPQHLHGMMFGLTLTVGILGGLNAGKPLIYLLDTFGWRQALIYVAFLGVAVFLVNLLILKEKKEEKKISENETKVSIKDNLLIIFKNKDFWIYTLVTTGLYIAIGVFGDVWGVSFLGVAQQMSRADAAPVTALIYIGMLVGSLMTSLLGQKVKWHKSIVVTLTLSFTVSLAVLMLFGNVVPVWVIGTIFFIFGIAGALSILCFVDATMVLGTAVAGTLVGGMNCIQMGCAAFVQHALGIFLDLGTPQFAENGMRIYSFEDYQRGFCVLLFFVIISLILSFIMRDASKLEPRTEV